jgi:hypothetical protein
MNRFPDLGSFRGMEEQYSWSNLEHYLPSFVQWCACDSGSNILEWSALMEYEIRNFQYLNISESI